MIGRLSMALFVAMMLTIPPVFAQENVITLDLGLATDEELAGALDAATELELIMRGAEDEPLPATEDAADLEDAVEELEYVAEVAEPEYVAEEPEYVAEVTEPGYVAEEPEVVEAVEPEYVAEYPEAVEAVEPEYVAEYPEAIEVAEPERLVAVADGDIVYISCPGCGTVLQIPTTFTCPSCEAERQIPDIDCPHCGVALQMPEAEIKEPEYIAKEAPEDVPNRYLLESQRLVRLAEEAYEQGDYEAATAYAQEASRYAQLSDEYIARQMAGAEAVADADVAEEGYPLPATFTVRSWATYRDCLWNIAALPEIYGDPHRWPILFNANRHRMPNPNNPDLILPGMVLEIPSIDGEVREGAWQSGRVYRSR